MKKLVVGFIAFVIIGMLFAACAGYLGLGDTPQTQTDIVSEYDSLILANGEFLSMDNANDITPFVFYGASTRIFFASDRDGKSMDIYCADVVNNIFDNLQVISGTINSTNCDEVQSYVFTITNVEYISVLRTTNGKKWNEADREGVIATYVLEGTTATNLVSTTPLDYPNTFMIPVLDKSEPTIILNAENIANYKEMKFVDGQWTDNGIGIFNNTNAVDFLAGCGRKAVIRNIAIFDGISDATVEAEFYVMQHTNSVGRARIAQGYMRNATMTAPSIMSNLVDMQFVLSGYDWFGGEFDDISPFIDKTSNGLMKVYFASTRYGKGKFDIYRYNTTTYNKQLQNNGDNTPIIETIIEKIYVSTTGDDVNDGLTPTTAKLSIQNAILEATNMGYSTIYVEAGVYVQDFGLSNNTFANNYAGINISNINNISLIGGWDATYTLQTGYSVLNGETTLYHIIWVENSTNFIIDGFTIINGEAGGAGQHNDGSGIFLKNVSHGLISNCMISNNYAYDDGGGIYATSGVSYIKFDSLIITNKADYDGAGIYMENGANNNEFAGSIIKNDATYYGGGVYLSGSAVNNKFTGSIIANTVTSGDGGGVYMGGSASNNQFTGSILSNSSGALGGGIYGDSGSIYNIFAGNISDNTAGSGGGGVALFYDSVGNVFSANISNNTATKNGGGVYLDIGAVSNIFSNNDIIANTAVDGGGIYLTNALYTMITNCVIASNIATNGGGIYLAKSTNSLIDITILCNSAKLNGGGIYFDVSAYNNVDGTISYNSTMNGYGGGIYMNNATYNMIGGVIVTNQSQYDGGGVYLANISGNNIFEGSIISNTAINEGGGVYIDNGSTFNTFSSNCIIRWNTSGGSDGGGVYNDNIVMQNLESGFDCSDNTPMPDWHDNTAP